MQCLKTVAISLIWIVLTKHQESSLHCNLYIMRRDIREFLIASRLQLSLLVCCNELKLDVKLEKKQSPWRIVHLFKKLKFLSDNVNYRESAIQFFNNTSINENSITVVWDLSTVQFHLSLF